MADEKKVLGSIIQIDGEDYKVTAERVVNKLTINTVKGSTKTKLGEFDGSEATEIDIPASGNGSGGEADSAELIKVNLDNGKTAYATINIRTEEPTDAGANIGDIWFKYNI